MMKHIKLFEDFRDASVSDVRSITRRDNDVLKEKSKKVTYTRLSLMDGDKEVEVDANITLQNNSDRLNDKSMSYILNIGQNDDNLNINIYSNSNEPSNKMELSKSYKMIFDKNNIETIIDMIEDSSDYLGGIDTNKIRKILHEHLGKKERVREVFNI